jgi:putative DNA primase/helicase
MFVQKFDGGIHYNTDTGQWMNYQDGIWANDDKCLVHQVAHQIPDDLAAVAAGCSNPTMQKELQAWAHRSESARVISATLKVAQTLEGVPVRQEGFDADPYLINTMNDTLVVDRNSATVTPRDHNPADLCTKQLGCLYDPEAKCPNFLSFLTMILPDKDVQEMLQRAVGRSLIGGSERRQMFICYGNGANGKTTLFEALMMLLNSYAETTPVSTVMHKREGDIPHDLARLVGKRLVTVSEPEQHAVLSCATIKNMVGGGRIPARHLFHGWFWYRPQYSIWLDTNYLPTITGNDNGLWDRILAIPFTVRIPDVLPPAMMKKNEEVYEMFRAELAGILNWALDGLVAYLSTGLGTAKAVEQARTQYREESDLIGQFLQDRCVMKAGAIVAKDQLYPSYRLWCENGGLTAMAKISLGKELRARRVEEGSTRIDGKPVRIWKGLELKPQ